MWVLSDTNSLYETSTFIIYSNIQRYLLCFESNLFSTAYKVSVIIIYIWTCIAFWYDIECAWRLMPPYKNILNSCNCCRNLSDVLVGPVFIYNVSLYTLKFNKVVSTWMVKSLGNLIFNKPNLLTFTSFYNHIYFMCKSFYIWSSSILLYKAYIEYFFINENIELL